MTDLSSLHPFISPVNNTTPPNQTQSTYLYNRGRRTAQPLAPKSHITTRNSADHTSQHFVGPGHDYAKTSTLSHYPAHYPRLTHAPVFSPYYDPQLPVPPPSAYFPSGLPAEPPVMNSEHPEQYDYHPPPYPIHSPSAYDPRLEHLYGVPSPLPCPHCTAMAIAHTDGPYVEHWAPPYPGQISLPPPSPPPTADQSEVISNQGRRTSVKLKRRQRKTLT